MTVTLSQINTVAAAQFVQLLAPLYRNASWVVERVEPLRPFATLAALKLAMVQSVRQAGRDETLALLGRYPGLGDLVAPASAAAADRIGCSAEQELSALAQTYAERFGFALILAPGGARGTGLSANQALAQAWHRLSNHADFEFAEAVRNIHRMAEIELDALCASWPQQGNAVLDWIDELAGFTDSPTTESEQPNLTVTYLTDAHRRCAAQLAQWMREDCGFDSVTMDAVGNVVGVYHGANPAAARLLTGSHYDTVRNGGRFDGRLGILTPMALVRELHQQQRRLPFGIEVVGFAEEEGQRYTATFLGSSALTGQFDPRWLAQTDADGVSMREAMIRAGLNIDGIDELRRERRNYLGFVEIHIEQGPVLNQLGLPLGVVTSINGSARFTGEIIGMASHAGTTPMLGRRDAAAAMGELLLLVEQRGSEHPDLVATVGMLEVPGGSVNIVPGRCRFSLDVRAPANAERDACVDDIKAGLQFKLNETMRASAAPCAAALMAGWEDAVASTGVPVHRMPSGAGHDAMKLHELMPQAMLFVRGENAGISHNPLESTTNNDIQLAFDAFRNLLDALATDLQ